MFEAADRSFEYLGNVVEQTSSRRTMMKRFAALGLVAAGAVGPVPLVTEATTGAPRITHYADPSKPPVFGTPKLLPFARVELAVGAAIRFSRQHVEAMTSRGVRFRVTCELIEFDPKIDATSFFDKQNGNVENGQREKGDDRITLLFTRSGESGNEPSPGAGGQDGWHFPARPLNSRRVGSIPFFHRVPMADLRQFDRDSVINLYAILRLYRYDDRGQRWIELPESRALTGVKNLTVT